MTARTRVRLLGAELHYPPELTLHTAVAHAISSLSARVLTIARSDGFEGVGEVRANIAYLTGLDEAEATRALVALCSRLPWRDDPASLLASLPEHAADAPRIARAVVESTLVEGLARAAGKAVAEWLGGAWRESAPTNHCLFWGPDDRFDTLAARYVGEGFRALKVRIGVGTLEQDLARLSRLRARFGPGLSIAVDANGAWSGAEAIRALALLEPLGLAYVEQPTPVGDWKTFESVRRTSGIPLMLDESLAGKDDIARLAQVGEGALAHLKIVKLGGPLAVMEAARTLRASGVGIMVGQMNEGALATALAAHCTMAIEPEHAELYGCYGLADDVTSGLDYRDGAVRLPHAPGLGVTFDAARCRVIWEHEA